MTREEELQQALVKMIENYQFECRQREKEMEQIIYLQREIAKKDIQLKYFTERTSHYAVENEQLRQALKEIYKLTLNPNKPCRGDVAIIARQALEGVKAE